MRNSTWLVWIVSFFYLRKSLCVVGLELLIKLFLANQFIALFKSYQGVVTDPEGNWNLLHNMEQSGMPRKLANLYKLI